MVTSPLAENVFTENHVPSRHETFNAGLKNSFLLLTADAAREPARLTGQFLTADGKVHHTVLLDDRSLSAPQ